MGRRKIKLVATLAIGLLGLLFASVLPASAQQSIVVQQAQPGVPVPTGQPLFVSPPQPTSGNAIIMQPQPVAVAQPVAANPILVPAGNQDWTWEQIVDVVDDYFRIERESRVQLVGNVVTEGRIDTYPQIGATLPEFHRPDSVGRYNRWESTFQTIRRRAIVRVIPDRNGYLIDLTVHKELEDLPHPENATAGAATFRNDSSLRSSVTQAVSRTRLSEFWIPLGRDQACEQAILTEIQARLTHANPRGVILR